MKLVSVVMAVALLLLGVRVLIGAGQRHDCGAPGGAAFMLSVQALGAAPSVTECLSLVLTAPAPPTTTPPATTPPVTTPEPEPDPGPPPTTAPDPLGDCEWIAADDNSGDGWWIAATPAGQPTCDRLNEGRHPPERLMREHWREVAAAP